MHKPSFFLCFSSTSSSVSLNDFFAFYVTSHNALYVKCCKKTKMWSIFFSMSLVYPQRICVLLAYFCPQIVKTKKLLIRMLRISP